MYLERGSAIFVIYYHVIGISYVQPALFGVLSKTDSEGANMTYCYNRLWKLLIDKGITKTEMRKQAGISTNVLAKMGKNEAVSMDTLAKISNAMKCGLDDIVEVTAIE